MWGWYLKATSLPSFIVCLCVCILTKVDKVSILDMSDPVEAAIEMCCIFRKRRDLFHVDVVAVHTPSDTHTQQTRGHSCRKRDNTVMLAITV